jgi:DNA-directed RNA polymerase subunit F
MKNEADVAVRDGLKKVMDAIGTKVANVIVGVNPSTTDKMKAFLIKQAFENCANRAANNIVNIFKKEYEETILDYLGETKTPPKEGGA